MEAQHFHAAPPPRRRLLSSVYSHSSSEFNQFQAQHRRKKFLEIISNNLLPNLSSFSLDIGMETETDVPHHQEGTNNPPDPDGNTDNATEDVRIPDPDGKTEIKDNDEGGRGRQTDPKLGTVYRYRTPDSGYWTIFLLPLAIYFADQTFLQQSLPAVLIISYNSLLLCLCHSHGEKFLGPRGMAVMIDHLKGYQIVMAMITVGYAVVVFGGDGNYNIVYEYMLWAGLNFSFPYVFANLVMHYPRSFTFGEGVIVTSGFVYNYWATFHNFIQGDFSKLQTASDPILITLLGELGFLWTILVCRGIVLVMKPRKVFALQEAFMLGTKVAFAIFLGKLTNPSGDLWFLVKWFLSYLLVDGRHMTFVCLWIAFLGSTLVFILANDEQETTMADRKFFHILICLIYLPAVLKDLNFMYLCSVLVFFCFVVIEAIRVLRLAMFGFRIGDFITNEVTNFRDKRDTGPLILTPIYLLVGCSAPIWLTGLYLGNTTRTNDNRSPEELAAAITGILSIGIGYTVARIVGAYGEITWPGTYFVGMRKTMEGTLSSIAAQFFVITCLCLSGYLPYTTVSLTALCMSTLVNVIVEAQTSQIDYLVVPLSAFITVHLVINISDYIVV